MVDMFKTLLPLEPPGPIKTEEDFRIYMQKFRDWTTYVESRINEAVIPQLRKLEAEIDTNSGVLDIDGLTDLADQPDPVDAFPFYDDDAAENKKVTFLDMMRRGTSSFSADSGSVQGGAPITVPYNVVSAVGTTGDSVTLPDWPAGHIVIVENAGANSLDLFPASGDTINSGSTDAAEALAAGAWCICWKQDADDWRKKDI